MALLNQIENYLKQLKISNGEYIYLDNLPKTQISESIEQTNVISQTETKVNENIVLTDATQKVDTSVPHDWALSGSLDELYAKIHNCQKCPLGATRNRFVFSDGKQDADMMIIGEAPGADEDKQGVPFVGRAGQLLTKILEAIEIDRKDVYIANILKCRPPDNRRPLPTEKDECLPYLNKQIALVKPKMILALGLTAATTLLKQEFKMGDIRGKTFIYEGTKMLVTYHPAALLRNPAWKKLAWEDVKLFKKLYEQELNS
jgi:uracil-DNA glycosylase